MLNTIFEVDGETIEVEGTGQTTCSAVLKKYKNQTVIIKAFHNPITNDFIPIKIR